MKPFDLSKAQAGEPILLMLSSESDMTPVRLVGMLTDGRHVVERRAGSGVYYVEVATEHRLRMAPQKRTVYANIYMNDPAIFTQRDTHIRGFLHDTPESARDGADNGCGGVGDGIIAVALPIEIEG
jgi:hypothetical protein